uniref:Transcription elongation factor SPT4 n=1 Tax=Poecilia reticulata TaxID=8081 RepID=A0A3P9NQL7_POERE
MALETVPKDLRHLRACLLCSLVKTIDQFEYDGCDNCESYLQMKGNREMVYECTSSSFDGVVAMMSPEDSWVAKWQRIGNCKPGVYAVSVTGRLPPGNKPAAKQTHSVEMFLSLCNNCSLPIMLQKPDIIQCISYGAGGFLFYLLFLTSQSDCKATRLTILFIQDMKIQCKKKKS